MGPLKFRHNKKSYMLGVKNGNFTNQSGTVLVDITKKVVIQSFPLELFECRSTITIKGIEKVLIYAEDKDIQEPFHIEGKACYFYIINHIELGVLNTFQIYKTGDYSNTIKLQTMLVNELPRLQANQTLPVLYGQKIDIEKEKAKLQSYLASKRNKLIESYSSIEKSISIFTTSIEDNYCILTPIYNDSGSLVAFTHFKNEPEHRATIGGFNSKSLVGNKLAIDSYLVERGLVVQIDIPNDELTCIQDKTGMGETYNLTNVTDNLVDRLSEWLSSKECWELMSYTTACYKESRKAEYNTYYSPNIYPRILVTKSQIDELLPYLSYMCQIEMFSGYQVYILKRPITYEDGYFAELDIIEDQIIY